MLRLGALVVLLAAAAGVGAQHARAHTLFHFADPRITEASGLAAGVASPGVFYVANDGGDGNRFFAIDPRTGATAATISVPGARNVDWEDLAAAPDPSGAPSVWLADIGDNDEQRSEIQVYRVAEPHVRPADRGRELRAPVADVWRLRYPGGSANAESLAVAPDGTAYIVTKTPGVAVVYRVPRQPNAGRIQLLRRVGALALRPTGTANGFGIAGQLTATGATIAHDGTVFVLRTYSDAYVWRLGQGGVPAALRTPPVRAPLPWQPQGEGIAVSGGDIVIDSEGRHTAVYSLALPRPLPVPTDQSPRPKSPAPSATSTGAAVHDDSAHDVRWTIVLAAGVAAAGVALGVVRMRKTRRHD